MFSQCFYTICPLPQISPEYPYPYPHHKYGYLMDMGTDTLKSIHGLSVHMPRCSRDRYSDLSGVCDFFFFPALLGIAVHHGEMPGGTLSEDGLRIEQTWGVRTK